MMQQRKRKPRSAKIFTMSGLPFPDPEKANPEVVEKLKDLLKLAEDGQIRGIAYVLSHPDSTCSFNRSGLCGTSILGGIALLQHQVSEDIIVL